MNYMKLTTASSIALVLLVLTGTGCVATPTSEQSPEDAAASLELSVGSEIALRETVLGLGGSFVHLFKKEDVQTRLLLAMWESGVGAAGEWSRQLEQETEVSQQARKDYETQYANSPVGAKLPSPPEAIFETIVEKGTLRTESLADSTTIFLPIFWKQNTEGGEGSGLLWLSQSQYIELVQIRHTNINLGLFDDAVSYAVGLTDQVKNLIDRLKGVEETATEQNVFDIQADIEWGTYALIVNGVQTTVQVMHAQNAFARYTILANQQNPLILELSLSPASRGSLQLFSREALGDAFWGYEVVSITHPNASTNADQLSP